MAHSTKRAAIGVAFPKGSGQRGIALITALFIIVIMMLLVGSLLNSMPQELRNVSYVGYDNRALYVADAGIQAMTLSIEQRSAAGLQPLSTPLTYNYAPEANGSSANYTATLLDSGTQSGSIQYYAIQSVGISPQGDRRRIRAVVQQGCFCGYNYMGKSNAPNNFFVAGLMQFNGPVYLEGTAADPVNLQWYKNVAALFLDTATIAGPPGGYRWFGPNGTKGSAAQPKSAADWATVDSHGSGYVSFKGANAQPFPPEAQNKVLANEAYQGNQGNGTLPAPSTNGVYVNQQPASAGACTSGVQSGIFVQGDGVNVAMSSSSSSQTFSFTGGSLSQPVTITANFANNTTTMQTGGGSPITCPGVPNGSSNNGANSANGAVFVNGNIGALSGSVHGQYTIGVPDVAGNVKDVHLTGNIKYQNDPKTCNCISTDQLGIIANNAIVSTAASMPVPLTLEAAIFAGNQSEVNAGSRDGSFVTDQGSGSGVCNSGVPLNGNLLVYGSLVNNHISPLGCFDPNSGKLTHGWADNYTFDTRFKYDQPPFFPNTNSYTIISWKDYGNT
ncbi:MAG: pilus assembly PilX N-terminal domain-containing protein [Candidatus Eremiobacteraeota bacterium]|nr:pilus assembly PilX N-terminal domain-containing protein [Candidatus Eremiobacteraeota bacterium]